MHMIYQLQGTGRGGIKVQRMVVQSCDKTTSSKCSSDWPKSHITLWKAEYTIDNHSRIWGYNWYRESLNLHTHHGYNYYTSPLNHRNWELSSSFLKNKHQPWLPQSHTYKNVHTYFYHFQRLSNIVSSTQTLAQIKSQAYWSHKIMLYDNKPCLLCYSRFCEMLAERPSTQTRSYFVEYNLPLSYKT